MKIKPEHLEHMRSAIAVVETKHPSAKQEYRAKELPITRYRWDVLHAAGLTPWMCSTLYPYLNDAHIETALKAIIPETEETSE